MKKKILIAHIRDDHNMADHEHETVMDTSKICEKFEITRHNVVHDLHMSPQEIKGFDAIIMGGSGAYSVLDDKPFIPYLENIARTAHEKHIPFFGICYGFQIAVQALGGVMISDPSSKEVGTYNMYKTGDHKNDITLKGIDDVFTAACGRKDRALKLPNGADCFIKSDNIPYHHLSFSDRPFYGVQFHPELWKREDNLHRLNYYKDLYGMSEKEYQEQLSLYIDAPGSGDVLKNFIDSLRG